MTSITYSSVSIQTSAQSVPSIPCWFGEVTLIVHYLRRQNVLSQIEEQVHFARRRFGHYDVIDFVAVLLGYASSGERTLEAFYQRVSPFASAFMALFGREHLPARSTLSRFLAALSPEPVEALRTLFLSDPAFPPAGKRGATGRIVGSRGNSVGSLRCRWHTRGGPPTGLASDSRSAYPPAPLASPVCSWLHRAQAWGSRAYAHHGPPSTHTSMAADKWN